MSRQLDPETNCPTNASPYAFPDFPYEFPTTTPKASLVYDFTRNFMDLSLTKNTPSQARAERRIWQFGGFSLDEAKRELIHDEAEIALERKAIDVLLHLLNHAGEVVTKDELLEAAWPGRVISDSVLTKTMSHIRSALADKSQRIVKTVHGIGYCLSCDVTVESKASVPSKLTLQAGLDIPGRPNWVLISQLGAGGYGEAWLGEHKKSHQKRVFKFASSAQSLPSLKREITLSRVLRECLGERRDFLFISDWNLGDEPFFIESDYLPGGNLSDWLQQNRNNSIDRKQRLELIAQVADALSAAHSVGVLHKDLKASNILVRQDGDQTHITLCDFGSGSVIDQTQLKSLGITQLGFTVAHDEAATTGGTPLYIAPEVLAGDVYTVRSDIYSLGVLLYQILINDLSRPLAQGWQADIDDELLREDIAFACEGHPEQRLSDASELARRLRGLKQRHKNRQAEREQQRRLRQSEALKKELRRLRIAAAGILLLAGIAITMGFSAYKARNQAVVAAEQAQAAEHSAIAAKNDAEIAQRQAESLNNFVIQGVLGFATPGAIADQDLTILSVLQLAAKRLDERLQQHPLAAAKLRLGLGNAFRTINQPAKAREQFEFAHKLYIENHGEDSVEAVLAEAELASVDFTLQPPQRAQRWKSIVDKFRALLPTDHPYLIIASTNHLTWQLGASQQYEEKLGELQQLVKLARNAPPLTPGTPGIAGLNLSTPNELLVYELRKLANYYWLGSRFEKMTEVLAEAIRLREASHGKQDYQAAQWRQRRALGLAEWGQFDEAEQENLRAANVLRDVLGEEHSAMSQERLIAALIKAWRGQTDKAISALKAIIDTCGAEPCAKAQIFVLSFARVLRDELQQSLAGTSITKLAEQSEATAEFIAKFFPDPAGIMHSKINLAIAQAKNGQIHRAWATLNSIDTKIIEALPPGSYLLAKMRRADGLLWAEQQQFGKAQVALSDALAMAEKWRQAEHWLVQNARTELDAVVQASQLSTQ